jgi:dolichyl-phosphate beta-glucosyltransferase
MGDKSGLSPELSIVIPAYNEAGRIGPTLEAVVSDLSARRIDYEIIVVSDGSDDATEDIVRDYAGSNSRIRLVAYSPNRGKGYAVRTGVLEARADDVLFSDADLATPMSDLEKLKRAVDEGCDVVIGSRALEGSVIIGWRPWYRELSGKVFNAIIRLLAVPGIRDTQCGFKYFAGGSGAKIFSATRLDGFGFDVEALYLARKYGLRVGEVAVTWENSPATKVSVLRHTLPMLIEVAGLRLNDWKKLYERPTRDE